MQPLTTKTSGDLVKFARDCGLPPAAWQQIAAEVKLPVKELVKRAAANPPGLLKVLQILEKRAGGEAAAAPAAPAAGGTAEVKPNVWSSLIDMLRNAGSGVKNYFQGAEDNPFGSDQPQPRLPSQFGKDLSAIGGSRLGQLMPKALGGAEGPMSNAGRWGLMGGAGLGAAGLGYGLYRMGSRNKRQPKEVEARDKHGLPSMTLVKRAAYVRRHNAALMVNRYLDKLAEFAEQPQEQALRRMQASLILGHNIHTAVQAGFPKLAADKRLAMAKTLVKHAVDDLLKTACGSSCAKTEAKSFHGKPHEAHAWMKANS